MKLLWKEWHQQKWIIFGGLLAGLSFPVIECFYLWKDNHHFRTDTGSAALLVGGAAFAIILAIATMHHDMRKGVDSFLQSKPIKLWKFFTIKFVLAVFFMYIAFLVVIGLDLITHFRRDNNFSFAWAVLCYTYPMALLLFAWSMFLMVVTRDAAKAAFLAIWSGLLIYFLPLMFRGMEWMNIIERLNNSFNDQPSVLQYLIWLCSVPEKINPGAGIYRPAGVPVTVYKQTVFQHLLEIVRSPAYLQYLLFATVFTMGSVVCVVFSVKALKHNWRWHPGQKSIVWAGGISLAAIFGFAMFQVGHNLEPVKTVNEKELVNPVVYGWAYMPMSLIKGFPVPDTIYENMNHFRQDTDAICIKDDLMFRFTTGYQSNKPVNQWDTELIRHFVLQVYEFPYAENNKALNTRAAPDFVIGATRFFQTEPVTGNRIQRALGCFIRGNRLYAAYRPSHKKGEGTNDNYPGLLNPMYFIAFDISDPASPKVVFNEEISNSDYFGPGMADVDDYCYISDGNQLIILSVENADKPEIIRKVTSVDAFAEMPNELVVGPEKKALFPFGHLFIQGNKLICWDSQRITIFNINDRLSPRVVYDDSSYGKYTRKNNIRELTFKDDKLYVGTKDGIVILLLKPGKNGCYTSRLIGQRQATPLEKLAGRRSGELILRGDYLIEQAGGFGVLIYDVSNPAKPRRVYHAQTNHFANDIGFWNGLLYVQEYYYKMSFYKLPKDTD